MASTQDETLEDNDETISSEIEALGAIYGEDSIIVNKSSATTSISIDLSSHIRNKQLVGDKITLSTQLSPAYPFQSFPNTPRLIASLLSSTQAASIISLILSELQPQLTVGEVCLFQYCESTIETLNNYDEISEPNSSKDDVNETEPIEFKNVIHHGNPLTDKKSTFQAHISSITDGDDIPLFIQAIQSSKKGHSATHIMWACRITKNGTLMEQGDDDGEKGAFKVIMHVLQQLKVENKIVAVCRWFGGVKLGPVRFRHIGSVTRDIVIQGTSK